MKATMCAGILRLGGGERERERVRKKRKGVWRETEKERGEGRGGGDLGGGGKRKPAKWGGLMRSVASACPLQPLSRHSPTHPVSQTVAMVLGTDGVHRQK